PPGGARKMFRPMSSAAPKSPVEDSLIPLSRAVELIAGQVYQAASRPLLSPDALNGLAGTVSALIPIFILDGGRVRRLSEVELDKALFRKSGSEMYFPDGRAPIANLAVTSEG